MVKLSARKGNAIVTIPIELQEPLGIFSGARLAVQAVGPCIVLSPLRDITAQGATEEAAEAFEAAIAAWKARPARGNEGEAKAAGTAGD